MTPSSVSAVHVVANAETLAALRLALFDVRAEPVMQADYRPPTF